MLYNQDWERKSSPLVDVLLKAADLLEQYGHTKGVRQDYNGSMCLLGALAMAQGQHPMVPIGQDTDLTYKASRAIVETLHLPHYECLGDSVDQRGRAVTWNNAKERTAQDVINGLRLTAYTVAANEKENA